MKISFILTGEGSSDLKLVDHIQNLLIEEGFSEVSGEAPDLGLFKKHVGHSVRAKLRVLKQNYPNIDLVFIHRDADNAGLAAREAEINAAAEGLFESGRVIPIIPVTMLETWLLADVEAIHAVAGGNPKNELRKMPALRRLEDIRNTKSLLEEVLCEASQTQGGRLKKFKKRFTEMRARLAYDLSPDGPVKQLASYQHFRDRLSEFSKKLLQE
ncbi:hypothetical protein ACBQ16_11095 [Halopseudomonas bauzanensis]|uniref:hypothetical protein n=1 Tax=Halopseudomonas bauzanensis TaxID=653930 RepID=UPI0035261840